MAVNEKPVSRKINVELSTDIAEELDYYVKKLRKSKKELVLDALKNYVAQKKQEEVFKNDNPGVRYQVKLSIDPIEQGTNPYEKASVLIY